MHHNGNLTITNQNVKYAESISSVGGGLHIRAQGASLPALESVSGWLYIRAQGASLPALERVGGRLDICAQGASLPVLERVGGGLHIHAEGASLPVLESVGGWLDIRAQGASLPVLERVGGRLDICAQGASLPVLERVGGGLYIHAQGASLPVLESVGGRLDICAQGASLPVLEKNDWRGVRGSINHVGFQGDFVMRGRKIHIEYVDYTSMMCGKWRKSGDFYICMARQFCGGDWDAQPLRYISRCGDITAHGRSISEAVDDLKFKIIGRRDVAEVVAEVKQTGRITRGQYHAITGACRAGITDFLSARGVPDDQESMSLDEALRITDGQYGGEALAEAVGKDKTAAEVNR